MPSSAGLSHIVRLADGAAEGSWRGYTLRTAFQPIFAFQPDQAKARVRIVAHEGLLRPFLHGEPVGPDVFFRQLDPADRFAVETLSRTLHLLNAGACLAPDAIVFVNFNPSLFVESEAIDLALRDLRLALHEARLDASRVVCEVTEQKSASSETLVALVEALRRHGFTIAVDDFGAAASDAARIEALKPDIVKFDAGWVMKLMDTPAGFAMLSDMVERFAAGGVITVFEGIEEGWQLQLAEKSGASMVQGFVLARPEITAARRGARASDP